MYSAVVNTVACYIWKLREWIFHFSSVASVQLFATPWTAAHQASLSITNSRSPPKPMCIESVMPSNHLSLCCPLILLPSIFPSIRVFSIESALRVKWPKYWSFSFNISPSSDKIFFSISLILYLYELVDHSVNLLWLSFHDICKPNHYTVHLQCCVSNIF